MDRIRVTIILIIAGILGLILVPLVSSQGSSELQPDDRSSLTATSDVLPSTSGTMNLNWNFSAVSWDSAKYPDCYIRLYGYMHTPLIAEFKILDELGINKTINNQPIAYTGLKSNSVYFINLQCQMNIAPFDSVNLDIIPVYTNIRNTQAVTDYYNCKTMPGINDCKAWQEEASNGKSWHVVWGNAVAK